MIWHEGRQKQSQADPTFKKDLVLWRQSQEREVGTKVENTVAENV